MAGKSTSRECAYFIARLAGELGELAGQLKIAETKRRRGEYIDPNDYLAPLSQADLAVEWVAGACGLDLSRLRKRLNWIKELVGREKEPKEISPREFSEATSVASYSLDVFIEDILAEWASIYKEKEEE